MPDPRKPWNPIHPARYRLPDYLRLEVLGPGGGRYPARLVGRKVVGACGPIAGTVPIRLVPRRPLAEKERERAVTLRLLLAVGGYGDVDLDPVDRRRYAEQPACVEGGARRVEREERVVCGSLF